MLEQVPRSCSILFRGNISPNRPTTALSRSIPITIFANIQFNQTWTFLISSLSIFQIIVPIIILNINPLCFFFETSRKNLPHTHTHTIIVYYLSLPWKKLRKSHRIRITWQIISSSNLNKLKQSDPLTRTSNAPIEQEKSSSTSSSTSVKFDRVPSDKSIKR